jgi:hypothetical protein
VLVPALITPAPPLAVPAAAPAPGSPALDGVTAALPDDTPASLDLAAPKLDFLAKPQAADELGRLGSYRVRKVLGAGAMGVVLQADDPAHPK